MKDKTAALLIFAALALACIASPCYAQRSLHVVFLNQCPDYTDSWDCLNFTQASQRGETLQQVARACRGIKCPTIYSVDPKRKGTNPDALYGDMVYTFGAWKKHGKIYFANMPGCPNARWELEKLLRRRR